MNVVDSSGWLEYFAKGKNAPFFLKTIQDTKNLLVPAICVYEVFKRTLSIRGEEDALQAVGIMSLGKSVELSQDIAVNAAKISHDLKIAMADSIILATARAFNAILWTQDADFEDLDGVRYIEKVY
ncbi:MAG: type II toxin-antitoxin system VapC family toxin [Desulfobacterales bacterium]|nr:type II toxin-antitoxin system VapC family toxin [Desulfobacterales bacterium]